jgi:hypothetical protein
MESVHDLTVNIGPVNEVLTEIKSIIKSHECLIYKLPLLESQQSDIRKEIKQIQLAISRDDFSHSMISPTHASKSLLLHPNLSKGGDYEQKPKIYKDPPSGFSNSCHLSLRRLKTVKAAVESCNDDCENSKKRDLNKGILGLNASVFQLQQEHNLTLAQNSEIENTLASLKNNLLRVEKEYSLAATSKALLSLKHVLFNKYDELLNFVHSFKGVFREEIEARLNNGVLKLNTQFNNLEGAVKQRQAHFNSQLGLFAKNSELSLVTQDVHSDITEIQSHIGVLKRSVVSNEAALLIMKKQACFSVMKKCHVRLRNRMLEMALHSWIVFSKQVVEDAKRGNIRKKKIRMILIKLWFERKQKAWHKWVQQTRWCRRSELRKKEAMRLIYRKMEKYVMKPSQSAFNTWRRTMILAKISSSHKESSNSGSGFDLVGARSSCYDLATLINSFKNDKDGALYTLAQEIMLIRKIDLGKIRRDCQVDADSMRSELEESITDVFRELEEKIEGFETETRQKISNISSEMPKMMTEISELRNSLHGTINRVKVIEQSHRDRIELLCESKEAADEKMETLELNYQQTKKKIQSLEYNNERMQTSVNTLLQKIGTFQRVYQEDQQSCKSDSINTNRTLECLLTEQSESKKKQQHIHEELIETRNDIIQFKISSASNFRHFNSLLEAHGVQKPTFDVLVQDAKLYEEMAKEKTYVVPINCVMDGGKEINIVDHIASFAHDYASWIAYQADKETLHLVIQGANPEEKICNEDDTIERRHHLLDE